MGPRSSRMGRRSAALQPLQPATIARLDPEGLPRINVRAGKGPVARPRRDKLAVSSFVAAPGGGAVRNRLRRGIERPRHKGSNRP